MTKLIALRRIIMEASFDIDHIIEILKTGDPLSEPQVLDLMVRLKEVLYSESNVLELSSPITICGDVHGQLFDVFQLFEVAGSPDSHKFLFMGDYVDRGYHSVSTFAYLAALKLKYPGQVFMIRGNHECRQINQMYGFYSEILLTYGHTGIWTLCNEIFDLLPMAASIDNDIFSVHGGLSPDIPTIDKINLMQRDDELPSHGPLCDLCWSDPEEITEWRPNQRGAGYYFGTTQTKEFCQINKIKFVTRSHQMAMDGFQWFFDNRLIIIWSAPNYMYRSGNKASVMKYGKEYSPDGYKLVFFDQSPDEMRKVPADIPTSAYFL